MDGISNIAGSRTTTIEANGKKYTLRPQVMGEYAERERYILSLRPDPMARLASIPAGLPDDIRKSIVDAAVQDSRTIRVVSAEEEQRFDDSLRGLGWRLYRALRTDHPEVDSAEKALALMEEIGFERMNEIAAKLNVSEEKDILPNSAPPKATN